MGNKPGSGYGEFEYEFEIGLWHLKKDIASKFQLR